MNKYIEIWFCIHVSKSAKVHEKKIKEFFEQNGGAQSLAKKFAFFAVGPLLVAILHLEQKMRKIL